MIIDAGAPGDFPVVANLDVELDRGLLTLPPNRPLIPIEALMVLMARTMWQKLPGRALWSTMAKATGQRLPCVEG